MLKRTVSAIIHAVFSTVLLLPPAAGTEVVWRDDSEVNAIAVDPRTPATIYAAVRANGVLRSTDGGLTWSSTGSSVSPYLATLAIDPQTSSIVYAGGSQAVFKSTNGGGTWTISLSRYVSHLAIDPQNASLVYASAPYGDPALYKSTDGGQTWNVALSFGWETVGLSNVVFDPTTPGTLYVGASYARCNWCEMEDWAYWEYWGQIFKSTDGGTTWTFGYLGTHVSHLAIAPDALYVVADDLMKSTDAGATWIALQRPDAMYVAVDPVNPSTVYASGNGVSRTTDAGATWQTGHTGLTDTLRAHGVVNPLATIVAVNPANPTTIYAGTTLGVFQSIDGGSTWNRTGLAQQSLLSSVSMAPQTATSGSSLTGTVTLADPAPAGGVTVLLAKEGTSNPAGITFPAAITVPAGARTVDFALTSDPVCTSDTVRLWATAGDGTRSAFVRTSSSLRLAALSLDRTSVFAGENVTATVTLTAPAPPTGGAVRVWTSLPPSAASFVTVPPGGTSANFTVSTSSVTSPTTVIVSALCEEYRSANFTATPQPSPPIKTLSLQPSSLPGGGTSTGTVTLSTAAPTGGAVVTLSSSNATVAAVPASVTVTAGATTVGFTVSTTAVTSAQTVTISAASGGVTRSAALTVTPPPTLVSISLSPTSVKGGSDSTGTITLSAAAPAGGVTVTLSSSHPTIAMVPSSITVPAGATSKTFTVSTTRPTSNNTTVTISANLANVTKAATLTVRR